MVSIVILTGAGVSAESGLGTFRDVDGIWTKYDLRDVATPEGFARNPALVHDFYNARRAGLLQAEPNAAHFALAELERAASGEVLIVTQNVDDLHERAGSETVLHMHGRLLRALCALCGEGRDERGDLSEHSRCHGCGRSGGMRPDVVWFGEIPLHMDDIGRALRRAEMFVSIGSSGQVYPAAAFVQDAARAGARTLELNLERTTPAFHESRQGKASEIVPAWVAETIARRRG